MEDYVANRRLLDRNGAVSTVASLDIGRTDMIVLYRFTWDVRSGRQNIVCLEFDGLGGGITGNGG